MIDCGLVTLCISAAVTSCNGAIEVTTRGAARALADSMQKFRQRLMQIEKSIGRMEAVVV